MDHVKLPENAAYAPLEVPDLCFDHYPQGLPFQTYPEFKQWTLADTFSRAQWTHHAPFGDDSNIERHPLEEATSFLQNWLFFGLITSLLGPEVPLQGFRRKTPEGMDVLTTAKLPGHIHALEQRDQSLIDIQIEHKRSNADQCLLTAHKVLGFVCGGTTIDQRVLLSLSALGDYLTCIRNSLYKFDQPGKELYLDWNSFRIPSLETVDADYLGGRLIRDKWCKSQVRRILRMSPSGAYYLTNLLRPDPERSHEKCTLWQCIAYQMRWETYQTHHTHKGCSCPFIFADTGEMCSMLAKGKIPVIPTNTPIEEGATIELYEAEKCKYVAISHVWSDGLGNTQHNALPQCQLRRICNLVQSLNQPDEPSYF